MMNLKELLLDKGCLATSLAMGIAIHLYSHWASHYGHFQRIGEDFVDGDVVRGTAKVVAPFFMPYIVSRFTKWRMERS